MCTPIHNTYNAFYFASLYRFVKFCGHGNGQPDVKLVTQRLTSFCIEMCIGSSV